jgi:hypothetical protein
MREETKLKVGELLYRLSRSKGFTSKDIDLVCASNFMHVLRRTGTVVNVSRGVYVINKKITDKLITTISIGYYHISGYYSSITRSNGK